MKSRFAVVAVYAAAMAWVESAVVFYLRTMIDRIEPHQPNPLPIIGNLGHVELAREAAAVLAPAEAEGQSALYSVLGHKSDLLLVHFREGFEHLKQAELALQRRNSDNKTNDREQQATEPIFVQTRPRSRKLRRFHPIVDPNNLIVLRGSLKEPAAKLKSDEPRTTGDQDLRHKYARATEPSV